MDEPTAWEDINPAMALAPRPEQQPACSERLQPAKPELFRNELGACLALVAPVGMDEEARVEWLAVAWQTLSHLPPDILAHGCQKARETADHPSKIVPAIVAATADWMETRRALAKPAALPPERRIEHHEEPPCTPEAAAAMLEEFGLRSVAGPEASRHFGSPRKPTRADYIAMGVDPAVLDACDSDGPRMAETNEDSARGEAGPARAEGIAQNYPANSAK